MEPDIKVFADAEALSHAVARHWQQQCTQAVAARGSFHVALSGGSTPRQLYTVLARAPFAEQLDWAHTHIYFGDERCVAPEHPDSNYRMAHEALLGHVALPAQHIHRIEGERPPEQAATHYAKVLARHLPTGADAWPCFDLVLLGIGEDGHTASLFPGTPIVEIDDRPVAAVHVPRLDAWRISLTLPVINHARTVLVLAAGAGKRAILHQVLDHATPDTKPDAPPLPIQRVRPEQAVHWYLDAAAAQGVHAAERRAVDPGQRTE